MKIKTQVYFLYIVALVVAALIYFTLDGTNDIVDNNINILYAVNLFSVVVPAVSLFFSYSWDNLAVNKKRLAQLKADARDRLRKRHVLKHSIKCRATENKQKMLFFSKFCAKYEIWCPSSIIAWNSSIT